MMIKKLFASFDMFGALPTLRMRGESEAVNLCAGVASFLLFMVFVYLFAEKAYKIMAFEEIEAKTTISVPFTL